MSLKTPAPSLAVSSLKRSVCSVSIDTLTPWSPASLSGRASSESRVAFVVMTSCSTSVRRWTSSTKRTMSLRTNGSPPVNRTRRMPAIANTEISRIASSKLKRSRRTACSSSPLGGMQ